MHRLVFRIINLTHILFIHWILSRQNDCSNSSFFFLSFLCIDEEAVLTPKNMCFIENRCDILPFLPFLQLFVSYKVTYIFSVVKNSGAVRSLYLICWFYLSVYVDLTSGKSLLCLPQIVRGKNYLNWDHR